MMNARSFTAEIEAEGKTKQLAKFVVWLKAFELELEKRKPTFTGKSTAGSLPSTCMIDTVGSALLGPQLVIKILEMRWKDYQGDLKSFTAMEEAPDLPLDGSLEEEKARNMTGTDESV
jgi:hypothetical protein